MLLLSSWGALVLAADTAAPPNVVIIFCDDLGYGDIGVNGAKGFSTPNIDRLAAEGRLHAFLFGTAGLFGIGVALMTGCYPSRVGIQGRGPLAQIGINPDETTLAEVLKTRGYATAIFGKWHLGRDEKFLPLQHGFDEYFGLPYSNDMWPHHPEFQNNRGGKDRRQGFPELPLIEGNSIKIEKVTSKEQEQLTTWYTEHAVGFIERNKSRPFFLYVPHSMPHVPLHVSDKFKGSSEQGLYGDVIQEIDWSVGQSMDAISKAGLDEKTLVLFTSDNGPWLSYGNHAGSAGPLREGKGTCWDGGVREPFVARWTGHIPAGSVCNEPAMTIDLLPTIARLAGADLPTRKIDGLDIWPLLAGQADAKTPHEAFFFYYADNQLQAVMSGRWKLVLPHGYRTMLGQAPGRDGKPGRYKQIDLSSPELFDLETDIGETKNIADKHPDIVAKLQSLAEQSREELGDGITKRKGKGARQPGRVP
ncbi:MAG: sulfatase [Planctomycetota bacterium]